MSHEFIDVFFFFGINPFVKALIIRVILYVFLQSDLHNWPDFKYLITPTATIDDSLFTKKKKKQFGPH